MNASRSASGIGLPWRCLEVGVLVGPEPLDRLGVVDRPVLVVVVLVLGVIVVVLVGHPGSLVAATRQLLGAMFLLKRNTLSGSHAALMRSSRSRLAP